MLLFASSCFVSCGEERERPRQGVQLRIVVKLAAVRSGFRSISPSTWQGMPQSRPTHHQQRPAPLSLSLRWTHLDLSAQMQIAGRSASAAAGVTTNQSCCITACRSSRAAGQHRGHQLIRSGSSCATSHSSSINRGQLQLVRSQFDVDDNTVEQLNVGELGPR